MGLVRKYPTKYLKIPNKVAEKRIIQTVINKFELSASLDVAINDLKVNGDITKALRCYRDLMIRRDADVFNKSEKSIVIASISHSCKITLFHSRNTKLLR